MSLEKEKKTKWKVAKEGVKLRNQRGEEAVDSRRKESEMGVERSKREGFREGSKRIEKGR